MESLSARNVKNQISSSNNNNSNRKKRIKRCSLAVTGIVLVVLEATGFVRVGSWLGNHPSDLYTAAALHQHQQQHQQQPQPQQVLQQAEPSRTSNWSYGITANSNERNLLRHDDETRNEYPNETEVSQRNSNDETQLHNSKIDPVSAKKTTLPEVTITNTIPSTNDNNPQHEPPQTWALSKTYRKTKEKRRKKKKKPLHKRTQLLDDNLRQNHPERGPINKRKGVLLRRRRKGVRRSKREVPEWVKRKYNATATQEFVTSIQNGWLEQHPHPQAVNLQGAKHAIVVPYRDRGYHLMEFIKYMRTYLKYWYTNGTFTLWVVEQHDEEPFNRAWLANVALHQIMLREPHTQCIVLHDVDMVPETFTAIHIPYHDCELPLQLAMPKLPILQHYSGGVTVLSQHHWKQINGLSNDFIGWGGEDDDLYHRLRLNKLLSDRQAKNSTLYLPRQPPLQQMQFTLISQSRYHHATNRTNPFQNKSHELLEEMRQNSTRWQRDGLSDLYYRIDSETILTQNLTVSGIDAIHHIQALAIPSHNNSTTTTMDHTIVTNTSNQQYMSKLYQEHLERQTKVAIELAEMKKMRQQQQQRQGPPIRLRPRAVDSPQNAAYYDYQGRLRSQRLAMAGYDPYGVGAPITRTTVAPEQAQRVSDAVQQQLELRRQTAERNNAAVASSISTNTDGTKRLVNPRLHKNKPRRKRRRHHQGNTQQII